jgi:hypothetical protein
MVPLKDPLLTRFWFDLEDKRGIGVTAYSREDAEYLINNEEGWVGRKVVSVIENVDIRTLDQEHIIPNMGAPNFRGIWYPNVPPRRR